MMNATITTTMFSPYRTSPAVNPAKTPSASRMMMNRSIGPSLVRTSMSEAYQRSAKLRRQMVLERATQSSHRPIHSPFVAGRFGLEAERDGIRDLVGPDLRSAIRIEQAGLDQQRSSAAAHDAEQLPDRRGLIDHHCQVAVERLRGGRHTRGADLGGELLGQLTEVDDRHDRPARQIPGGSDARVDLADAAEGTTSDADQPRRTSGMQMRVSRGIVLGNPARRGSAKREMERLDDALQIAD